MHIMQVLYADDCRIAKKKKTISSESDCLWCQSVEQHFLSFKMQTIPNFCFNILSILWTFLDAFPTAPSYLFSPSLCFSYCVACLVLEFMLGIDFTLGRFWSKRFCWVFLLCRGRMKSSPWGCPSQNWQSFCSTEFCEQNWCPLWWRKRKGVQGSKIS